MITARGSIVHTAYSSALAAAAGAAAAIGLVLAQAVQVDRQTRSHAIRGSKLTLGQDVHILPFPIPRFERIPYRC